MMAQSKLRLNTGATMPALGLGTWKSELGQVGKAVKYAVEIGYRHIDCAEIYGNESEIGEALADLFNSGIVTREELFITTKIFNNFHGERAHQSISKSLSDLRLEYVDLLLMHWPISFRDPNRPKPLRTSDGYPNPNIVCQFEFLDTWKEMEKILKTGKTKAIGVSNFTVDQLEQLIANCEVIPAVNQVEMHPLLSEKELREYCKQKGVIVTAYSPLGSPDSVNGKREGAPKLLTHEVVTRIAEKHNRSPAQVLIRWALQKGVSVIPKSVTPARIQDNFKSLDPEFQLTAEEEMELDSMNQNYRYGLGWMPGHFLPTK